MRVDVTGVSVSIAGTPILERIDMDAPTHQFIGLLGPNGSGKTTLLRAIYRAARPNTGTVLVGGDDVWNQLSARECAHRTAAVLQDEGFDFEFTVRETVHLGRVPHHRIWDRTGSDDQQIVTDAMQRAGIAALAERLLVTLSGGERQRVFLARALAQQAPVIVLDEPTNHLDIAAQVSLLATLRDLPATVIAALHDLNLAVAYCDLVYLLDHGRVIAHGPPDDVLTEDTVRAVYGVTVHRTTNPLTGRTCLHYGHPHTDPNTAHTTRQEITE